MFNQSNLIFISQEGLKAARELPFWVWLAFGGLASLAYLLRSYALWSLGHRVHVKVGFTAFFPFLKPLAYRKIGVATGLGPWARLLSLFLIPFYFLGILLLLLGSESTLLLFGASLALVTYVFLMGLLSAPAKGILGREPISWFIPIIGSIIMLVHISSSRSRFIYIRPRNYDGLFRKADDVEISL